MLNTKNMHYYTRESLYKLQGPRCNICSAENTYLEVDHIVPVCLGGNDALVNLQLLCGRCNNIKSGYTPEQLNARGETHMASRLTQIQTERAAWTEAYIISRLQLPPPLFKAADYQTYALLANPNHAFGIALTAKMLDRCISETQLIREIRAIVGSCYAQNLRRWKRNNYPSPAFFRALSVALDWPIKTMCRSVDFRRYSKAMKHEPLFDLMPYILQNGWTTSEAIGLVQQATPKRLKITTAHIQRYFSNGVLVEELLPALTTVFPNCSPAFFYNRANETLSLAALRERDRTYYSDGKFPRRARCPCSALRYQGFRTFIKLRLAINRYTLSNVSALDIDVPQAKRLTLMLAEKAASRIAFNLFALLNLLGDFTIHDVPSAYLHPKWNIHEIALRTSLAMKALIKQELQKREMSLTAGCRALGLAAGTLTAHIKNWDSVNTLRDRGIAKTKFKQIRAFFGWQPAQPITPRHYATQMRYERTLKTLDAELAHQLEIHGACPPYNRMR